MIIAATDLTKRFYNELIFKNLSLEFSTGESYAIVGPNGCGKSTLLKILSGITPPSKGSLGYKNNTGETLEIDLWYKYMAFVSPYLELPEEFTLIEFLKFHSKFKPVIDGMSIDKIMESSFLTEAENKQIHFFSSGMKQRLKLTLAFFFKNEVIFLDEPTTNLDEQGILWYQENIKRLTEERLLFIASNQLKEYDMCSKRLNILDYK